MSRRTARTVRRVNVARREAPCPLCNAPARRHSIRRMELAEIGISRPTFLDVTYSKHYCDRCCKHFTTGLDNLAFFRSRFTHRVLRAAVAMVTQKNLPLAMAAAEMRRRHRVRVPVSTLHA